MLVGWLVLALQYGSALGGEGDKGATDDAQPLQPTYETVENRARVEWENVRGNSNYTYDQARSAIRDAYERKAQRRRDMSSATSADERNS